MHDYLLSTEWVRFAFVLGIAVSMLLYERRHLTTGSIVVPGYIAVFLLHPLVLIATFLNALVTYALVNRVLRRYVLLYGRAKFTVLAVISTIVQTAMLAVSPSGPWLWEHDIAFFVGAGYIVPALIAHDMARQGLAKTTTSVLLAGALVAVPIMVVILLDLPGVNDLSPVGGFGNLAFPVEWLPFAIVVSVIASWAVARNYDARSGGFVGAAFVGMFMADVWQIAAALSIAAISYLVVTKLLMSRLILFGRRKFSAMLLVSATVAWTALWVGSRILPDAHLDHIGVGSLALTPLLLPGLLANDAQRTSPGRVLVGAAVAATCTVTTTWWAGATVTGQHLELRWKVVAAATVLLLLWPQARDVTRLIVARVGPAIDAADPAERLRGAWATIRAVDLAFPMRVLGGAPTTPYPAVATVPTQVGAAAPRPNGSNWSAFARAYPEHAADAQRWLSNVLDLGSGRAPTRVAAPSDSRVTTSTPKSAFARAHPQQAAAAQHWLSQAIDHGTRRTSNRVEPSAAPVAMSAPRPGPVREVAPAPTAPAGGEPSRATDLERMARHALTRLVERRESPLGGQRASSDLVRPPTLQHELLSVDRSTGGADDRDRELAGAEVDS